MSFENKVIIITGSASGIGACAAKTFAKQGAIIVAVDIDGTKLKSIADEISKIGKKPLAITADVSNDEDAVRIVAKCLEEYSRIDVFINNAGISRHADLITGNITKIFDEVMSVNLRACIKLTELCIPHLIKSKGNIIIVSSVAGLMPSHVSVYAISKAGLTFFGKALALEVASKGVRVNIISPGPVRTNILRNSGIPKDIDDFITPLDRVSDAVEIVDMMLFLASDKAIGVTGSDFVVDNGVLLSRPKLMKECK